MIKYEKEADKLAQLFIQGNCSFVFSHTKISPLLSSMVYSNMKHDSYSQKLFLELEKIF